MHINALFVPIYAQFMAKFVKIYNVMNGNMPGDA
jgi:hypothetical protein